MMCYYIHEFFENVEEFYGMGTRRRPREIYNASLLADSTHPGNGGLQVVRFFVEQTPFYNG